MQIPRPYLSLNESESLRVRSRNLHYNKFPSWLCTHWLLITYALSLSSPTTGSGLILYHQCLAMPGLNKVVAPTNAFYSKLLISTDYSKLVPKGIWLLIYKDLFLVTKFSQYAC